MRIGLLQYNVSHDINVNFAHVNNCLSQHKSDLLLLPELSMCGYLFESREALFAHEEEVPAGAATQRMMLLSGAHACTIIFGLAERENDKVYNTAVVVSKGRYIGKYRKIHLSDFEKKLFERGGENTVFAVDGFKIGVQICFDLWFPELSRTQRKMGANLFCVLANFGGQTSWRISQIRAIENLTPLALCNRVGEESIDGMDADFLGKSTLVNADGQLLCVAPEKRMHVCVCDIPASISKGNSNVICSNFDAEIALHDELFLRQ